MSLKSFSWAVAGCLIVVMMALIAGCSLDSPDLLGSDRATSDVEKIEGIPDSEFQPIAFRSAGRKGIWSAKTDPIVVTELIRAEDGGQLLLDWESQEENGNTGTKVKVEVKVLPDALEEDTEISIGLLNPAYAMLNVDLEFREHGTQFLIPAEVKLDLVGLDLSGYDDEEALDLYWYNPEDDTWYPVPYQFKKVELDLGKVQGIWYFEHFSRYAWGNRP